MASPDPLSADRLPDLAPGTRVGTAVLGPVIGRGATSTVHRATTADGSPVAVKVLDVPGASRDLAGRLRREFELARELAGPHVIAVHEHGTLPATPVGPARPWISIELVDGGSGAGLVPTDRTEPDLDRVLAATAQVAGALDGAHRRGVVHRDVKPANVLLRAGPALDAVLTDFGTAQLLDDARPLAPRGRVAGSLPYAAPEVLTARRLSPATDVYSLACTVVEWLTGEPPFPRATAFAVTHAHLTAPPPSLRVRRDWLPGALDAVLARGLAKDPADRYPGCGELSDAVGTALAGAHPPRPGEAPPARRRLFRRRPR